MSDRYGVVINGVVVNIVVWDGNNEWKPEEGETVKLSEDAGIGWHYKDGEFTPPEQPAIEAK